MKHFEGRVLDGHGMYVGSGITLDDEGQLERIGVGGAGSAGPPYIVPGFVDIHCHGGGGASFPDDLEPESIELAIGAHRARGTTAVIASLVSMADPLPAIEALVPFCENGELAGIHMEGPFVSPHKAGAQNPAAIRAGDLEELAAWLRAGRGWIRTMTIAPEIPRAHEVAAMLLAHGAKPSWGHTNATGPEAAAAIEFVLGLAEPVSAGSDSPSYNSAESHTAKPTASALQAGLSSGPVRLQGIRQTATHLFNAMPALGHRAPGPVREYIQAARRGEIAVELIADGVHLAPELVEDVVSYVGSAGTAVFVTDAMAAAGMPEGSYQLGGLSVQVRDGAARLSGSDTIAGGCTMLADQVELMAGRGLLSLGQTVEACVAGPTRAASLLREGREARGITIDYEIGAKPNFVVLDADYRVIQVIREGVVL
ncbi:N-acetylglucosamine-6-phosphate deacetylase [Ancrocorticia populi]|uniref:N-acetylglucosamine-6-phosphate deacetylase n=1 Tax=Ancrocorticia populi TaxID=2175228 RepID=UPI0023540657|nr:amidohydrolase family protein [Ancrocorticia populi]